MASLVSGQTSQQLPSGPSGPRPIIPPPPSFIDFRFKTIGQEPELLKRISAPLPDIQYHDRSSPSPSISAELEYPSLTPEPSRSRPSLLEALSDPANPTDTIMTSDPVDEMVVEESSISQNVSQIVTPLPGISRAPLGWNENAMLPARAHPVGTSSSQNGRNVSPTSSAVSQARENQANQHLGNCSATLGISTAITAVQPSTLDIAMASSSDVTSPILQANGMASVLQGMPLPLSPHCESQYTFLRTLQTRIMSSLSNLSPPDTTNALLLVQSANTHSASALARAHRSHTLAQQALESAREAVAAAQESLGAAEQAKAHASDAVAAIEQIDACDSRGPRSEWEWKSVISNLQNDLRALGEWVGEKEGEEATMRRQMEKEEDAKKDKHLVDVAMKIITDTNGGLDQQTVQAMSAEVSQRTAAEKVRSKSVELQVTSIHPLVIAREREHQRSAELEADTARRAWSLEHGRPAQPNFTASAVDQRLNEGVDFTREREKCSAEEFKLEQELMKRDEEAQMQREQEKQEATIKAKRLQELEQQKLEVAKFRMLERERQERLQREESARVAADALRLKMEMEAVVAAKLVEQQKFEADKIAMAEAEKKRPEEAEEAGQAAEARELEEKKKAQAKIIMKNRRRQQAEELTKKHKTEKREAAEAEARELQLREAQEKKRQEVMAQKQRASAETAARILAERAREKELKGTTLRARSPIPHGSRSPPLPSPTTPMHRGGLIPRKTPPAPEGTNNPKAQTISGSVRVDAAAEPQQEQPTPRPPSPSPSSAQASFGSRSKDNPIPSSPQHNTPGNGAMNFPRASDPSAGQLVSSADSTSTTLYEASNPPAPADARTNLGNITVHQDCVSCGNVHVVPKSEVPSASPQVHTADPRFSNEAKGADTHIKPHRVKSEPLEMEMVPDLPPRRSKRKAKDDITLTPLKVPKRPRVRRGKVNTEPDSPAIPPMPNHPNPHPPVDVTNIVSSTTPSSIHTLINAPPIPTRTLPNFRKQTTMATAALPTLNDPTEPRPTAPTSSTSTTTKPVELVPSSQTRPSPRATHTTTISPMSASDGYPLNMANVSPQFAPAVYDAGGRDNTPHQAEELSNGRETGARGYQSRRGDHYSPPARVIVPPRHHSAYHSASQDTSRPYSSESSSWSPPSPQAPSRPSFLASQPRTPSAPRSAIRGPPLQSTSLGKRPYRDDDQLDRSPGDRYWQADEREEQSYRPRSARSPPPRLTRVSPPSHTGALQSRIGLRDSEVYKFSGGQSYRPTYTSSTPTFTRRVSDTYRPAENSYASPEQDHYSMGNDERYSQTERDRPDLLDRMTEGSSGRGRSVSGPRGYYNRGRGGRGASRPLEQRISSNKKTLTLMHRLERTPS